MRLAAIDCGTHSIRLLISEVDPQSGAMADVMRLNRIVGLGEGVDRTGHLSEAALERTFVAVEEYAGYVRREDVQRIRMVATSASRDADNFSQFSAGVQARLGITPEVISGQVEATLGFTGTLSAHRDIASPALTVDIGGGSTEFAFGEASSDTGRFDQVTAAVSMNMGSTRVTERYLRPAEDARGVPSEDAISQAGQFVDSLIAQAGASVPLERAREVVGVAGSVTTLTALELGLDSYEPDKINGAVLDSGALRERARRLIRMPHAEKAQLGPMHPQRVRQIAGGVLVWERILAWLEAHPAPGSGTGRSDSGTAPAGAPRGTFPVRTSENDILDGIILSQIP